MSLAVDPVEFVWAAMWCALSLYALGAALIGFALLAARVVGAGVEGSRRVWRMVAPVFPAVAVVAAGAGLAWRVG